jgi:hydrogenase maturation protein HypF
VQIRGAVQGVGYRPFVYRLATELGLHGWVLNSASGVFIEVEGPRPLLEQFLLRLSREKPPRSFIQSLESSFLDPCGYSGFEIRESDGGGDKTALVLPDIATCPECLAEVFDRNNRRFLYPFTNCTICGPRFSIITALPYDRPSTTMRGFVMCERCRREYHDPLDRRFHAQPNACSDCGPQLELWNDAGRVLAKREDALLRTSAALREGKIVAVKGIGGFHLMVLAGDEAAVARLRERKHREEKPLALMYSSVDAIRCDCEISELEARLLSSAEAPIVLLQRRSGGNVAPAVAPGNSQLGVMLPYTPLHHILLRELNAPVVATSGNLSDEPICTDEREALDRLRGIADLLLVHNRPIARHVDDSVVRVMLGRELVMRRARGYAPLPVPLKEHASVILAVGAHLKNTVALSAGANVFISQHIGDLETTQALEAFRGVIDSFKTLFEATPERIACDLHPDYLSTKYAREQALPLSAVQHHFAHVVSCMAENELDGQVLGVSWDGTGFGLDGTIWGGEFLLASRAEFTRVGHLRTFRLTGGSEAIKEPRRCAIGVLYEVFGEDAFDMKDLAPLKGWGDAQLGVIRRMLRQGLNCPVTSSAGRLFDAVAALAGGRQRVNFEGQAAMELEFALAGEKTEEAYPLSVREGLTDGDAGQRPAVQVLDWEPMVRAVIEDVLAGTSVGRISAKFHNALADGIVELARRAGQQRVVLSGGCFQNRYLTERAVTRLTAAGFRPYWHQRVPPNDGGIALGQLVAAANGSKPRQ